MMTDPQQFLIYQSEDGSTRIKIGDRPRLIVERRLH